MRVPFSRWNIGWQRDESGSIQFQLQRSPKKADRLTVLESDIQTLKKENARLEGLLDLGPDPDQNLTGEERHSLFRTQGTLGKETRDFNPTKRTQILNMSHQLYALRGTAYNIIELYIDHIVGERLVPTTCDHCEGDEKDTLQKEIDEVWKDRRNRLPYTHEDIVRDGELEGEAFYIADYFPDTDGHIVLGYFPPENVRKVQKNSLGRDVMIEVDPQEPGAPPRRMFVLNSMHPDIHITRNSFSSYTIEDRSADANPQAVNVDGLVFARFVGRPNGATRGRPRLQSVLDYIDIEDELVWSATEREKLLRMFILDITDNSVQNPQDGDRKLREMGLSEPPQAPKVLIHNERMKIDLMSPSGSARPAEMMSEVVSGKVYGSQGLPAHYSGRDSETPSGTSKEQGLVPGKRLRRAQQNWIDWLSEVVALMISLRRRAASETASFLEPEELKFKHMEVGGKDKSRGAAMIKDLAISLGDLVEKGLIKKEAANEILEHAFEEAGFSILEKNRGLGEAMIDQLATLQSSLVGNTRGGVTRPGNRGESGGDDPQRRDPRSVRRGDR